MTQAFDLGWYVARRWRSGAGLCPRARLSEQTLTQPMRIVSLMTIW
jgi:hypothetical protein